MVYDDRSIGLRVEPGSKSTNQRLRVAAMPSALLAAPESSSTSVFVWSLVLVAAVIGGFWLVTMVKRWLTASGDEQPKSLGFSLADLRELHRSGKLSDEEFERARTKMAASLKRDLSKPPRPKPDQTRLGGGGGGETM